ncbi:MAG: hypothetical protein KIS62_00285 [Ramlibacter sp.]|nr:hypothetical protein [Ramlibacter sp.]MCW5648160.1 hypothetical protein [Ramlibacter sp.]
MASSSTIAWLERGVWICIYAGLLLLVLGLAVHEQSPVAGTVMVPVGVVLAGVGVVLIWVRSRLREDR